LVQVEAVGVTLPGLFHLADAKLPARPGGEIAGRVSAIGAEVTRFSVGQAVAGLTMFGAMAEYTVAPVVLLDAIPEWLLLRR
jgi:NADPH:quinone reductase-like Zn-dependent oxidoreductase